ncbi:hypothetical protein MMC25_007669 [Agyrium rufum]|nr:hypothetical protein [Agyrium rufum]
MSLPSKHEGGDVEVAFGKETRRLNTSQGSKFGFSYLAWYSDIEYAVQKVTSGHRLVLTYNLIHKKQGSPPRAESSGKPEQDLAKLFTMKDGQSSANFNWPVAYVLNHQYTEANLRMDHLKGKDRAIATSLQRACEKGGLSMHLSNMAYEITGGCDEDSNGEGFHDIDDEIERELKLTYVVRPNGALCAKDLPFGEEHILQEEPFKRRPDDEEFSGWTGNEGTSTTHFYRDSCIIITDDEIDSLEDLHFTKAASSSSATSELFDNLMSDLWEAERHGSNPTEAQTERLKKCRFRIWKFCYLLANTKPQTSYRFNAWGPYYGESTTPNEFIGAMVAIDDVNLFKTAVQNGHRDLGHTTYKNIGSALAFQLSDSSGWLEGVATAVKTKKKVEHVWASLKALRQAFEESLRFDPACQPKLSIETLDKWIYDIVEVYLTASNSDHRLDVADGETLIGITRAAKNNEKILFSTVLPYVKRKKQNKSFVVSFLFALFQAREAEQLRTEVVKNLYRDIISDLGPILFDSREAEKVSRMGYGYGSGPYGGLGRASNPFGSAIEVEPKDLASLCWHCSSLDLNDETRQILRNVIQKSGEGDVDLFQSTWIPFLKHLLIHVNNVSDEIRNELRLTCEGVITNYIRRYLIKEPLQPLVTARRNLGCKRCDHCRQLDAFLNDPKWEIGKFAAPMPIRKHLETQVGRHYYTTTEKHGSPHQLLVHKNHNEFIALRDLADFKYRREQVLNDVRSIGTTALGKLLGTKALADLVNFDSPRNRQLAASGSVPAPVSIPAPAPAIAAATAQERPPLTATYGNEIAKVGTDQTSKVGFIDLTEE